MNSQTYKSFRAYDRNKRIVDASIALAVLPFALPLIGVVWLLVRTTLGSPAFFWQWRPGLAAKPFQLVKFRTMSDARDTKGDLLSDAERLTRLGHTLRALSLDELPQLWNILRGDMSIVGPRPLLLSYVPLFSPAQARRHEVRPGLTGWAQVNGRNNLDWERRLAMDVWYVDNRSFGLDLQIIFKSIAVVLKGRDVVREGTATMPKFTGSKYGAWCQQSENDRKDKLR